MTNIQSLLGGLDEALMTGTRALDIADRLGDLRLRIVTTTYLEQVHSYMGDYAQVIELASRNLETLPPDWNRDFLGASAPVSVYDRFWLVTSLAQLGRFSEVGEHEAKTIELAEATEHGFTIALAHFASSTLHLLKGNWAKARSVLEPEIQASRKASVLITLPFEIASSAWVLAQLGERSEALNRIREGEQLLKGHATRGVVGQSAWAYHALGRACLLLDRHDDALRLGRHAIESSPKHYGFIAHALHLLGDIAARSDRLDRTSAETNYRNSLALAGERGMRPLAAHCHLSLAKLSRFVGEGWQVQEHLATAAAMYRDMDMRFWLEQAEAQMRQPG